MLILTRSDARGLLRLEKCISSVEEAFAERGRGAALEAHRFHVASGAGAFHLTAGGTGTVGGGPRFGVKVNGRFPPEEAGGSERVTGAILLSCGESGRILALLDSLEVTILRTAAVTAVALRHLARPDARTALLIGAGTQARMQLEALRTAPGIEQILVHDVSRERARALVQAVRDLGLAGAVADDPDRAAGTCDVIVTVTPAVSPVLTRAPRGCLVVALGADGPGKRELGPEVVRGAKVVVDVLEQAAAAGELRSAIADGLLDPADVHAELGDIVAGRTPGRTSPDEVIVFDATGTALQDVAASRLLVEAARRAGRGTEVRLDR